MKSIIALFFLIIFSLNTQTSFAQTTKKKTVKQKAHDKKNNKEEFILSNEEEFQVNVYTVDEKSMTQSTHHWFLELRDKKGKPINYAKVKLSGYLKADPKIEFIPLKALVAVV